jgi:hypothetical protein
LLEIEFGELLQNSRALFFSFGATWDGGGRAHMMNLQQELDALIESTMAFANDVKRRQPIADLPAALRMAEGALAEPSKPIQPLISITPASERDEIRQRVSNFKAHQEKMAREREEYYLQMKARMLAIPTISLPSL